MVSIDRILAPASSALQQCPQDTEECGTPPVCTNTVNSPANCGGCGMKCAKGEICQASECACPGGFNSCAPAGGGAEVCTNVKVDEVSLQYVDYAHFSRRYKEAIGETPDQTRARRGEGAKGT